LYTLISDIYQLYFRGFSKFYKVDNKFSAGRKKMGEKILIVDDSEVNRRLLFRILKKEGYELIEARDGEEAIEIAFQELPDLILLDIMMPKKDGYEVCAEIKSKSYMENIPIIFLSGKSRTEDKIKGLDLGGADYVTKPFERGEVLARVKAQLKIHNLNKKLMEVNESLVKKQKQIEEDLKAAAEIQGCLLPSEASKVKFFDISWKFMPCEKIGGDIFNFFQLDEEHWAFYIVDVSGHGVPSAMMAVSISQIMQPRMGFILKKSINSRPYYEIVTPAEVLSKLDREYPFTRFDKFFTMSYLIVNKNNGILKYSNAGHPPPVLIRQDGSLEFLKEGGTIIGMGGITPFEEGKKQLKIGDKLLLYTDGIMEYQNSKGNFYGKDRFYNELQKSKDQPVCTIIEKVIDSMMKFGSNIRPQDDVSLLGIEFKGEKDYQPYEM
ncbi:MAG: hypothetical protein DRG25_06675, partial [Deltaproteobacteria bacterium]